MDGRTDGWLTGWLISRCTIWVLRLWFEINLEVLLLDCKTKQRPTKTDFFELKLTVFRYIFLQKKTTSDSIWAIKIKYNGIQQGHRRLWLLCFLVVIILLYDFIKTRKFFNYNNQPISSSPSYLQHCLKSTVVGFNIFIRVDFQNLNFMYVCVCL